MNEPIELPVDDLTDESCGRCGSRFELDRPKGRVLGGRWYGEIVCTPCLAKPPS